MRFRVVIPVIHEATTDTCLRSINPWVHEHMLLIDNSFSHFTDKYAETQEFQVLSCDPPANIGVARAWNIGAKDVISRELDYLVVMSAAMVFEDGMLDFIEYLKLNTSPWGMLTQHGWHLLALSRRCLKEVGLFDENFYPAYYEDSDYVRRLELRGIHLPRSMKQRLPTVDIKATHQSVAHGMTLGSAQVNMGACRRYFIDKWGADPGYATQEQRDQLHLYPFNNPSYDISYWPRRSITELRRLYKLPEIEEVIESV